MFDSSENISDPCCGSGDASGRNHDAVGCIQGDYLSLQREQRAQLRIAARELGSLFSYDLLGQPPHH